MSASYMTRSTEPLLKILYLVNMMRANLIDKIYSKKIWK